MVDLGSSQIAREADIEVTGTTTSRPQAEKGAAEIQRDYAARGYELLLPDDVLRLSPEDLAKLEAGVTEVLDEVYLRKRDLSEGRTRELVCEVANGRVLLFALLDSDRMVVATIALIRVQQILPGSPVSSFEVGRAAKRPGTLPRLATGMIRGRVQGRGV